MRLTTDQIRSNSKAAVKPAMNLLEALQTEVGEISLQTITDVDNTTSNDIEITDETKGIILKSPDGTRFRLTIEDAGTLTITDLTPPP